ncbi:MAG: hypothetical protein EAZ16_00010 [Sphingobacteriales bacterium]|nr:MAG: hypothetical protein EAZ16_00010 [Sphingobacteriales bacterium]
MKDNGQTALSRQTDVAIFALPIIVPSEEVCDASGDQDFICCQANNDAILFLKNTDKINSGMVIKILPAVNFHRVLFVASNGIFKVY